MCDFILECYSSTWRALRLLIRTFPNFYYIARHGFCMELIFNRYIRQSGTASCCNLRLSVWRSGEELVPFSLFQSYLRRSYRWYEWCHQIGRRRPQIRLELLGSEIDFSWWTWVFRTVLAIYHSPFSSSSILAIQHPLLLHSVYRSWVSPHVFWLIRFLYLACNKLIAIVAA